MTAIKILDESGDKKYFTQIPNYIANHSTANDQALYFQMKRYAGEDGQCYATQETLCKKLGIGIKAYNKSLNYLLSKKWIKYVGMTKGKTRPIKTYAIVDIWKLNIMEYDKILAESTISFKRDTSQKEGDTSPKHSKILLKSTIEEEQYKQEHINNNIVKAGKPAETINFLIKEFEIVNPTINYGNKTQRKALEELVKKFGYDKTLNTIKYAMSIQGQNYAPTITTPHQLKEKIGDLLIYYKKEHNSQITII